MIVIEGKEKYKVMNKIKYLSFFERKLHQLLGNKYIKVNLQLFAQGDKTETATSKKRQDARKKGQVLQSKEITSAIVLLALFIGLKAFGGYIYTTIEDFTKRIITEYSKLNDLFTVGQLTRLFFDTATVLLKATAPMFAIAIITGLAGGYAQVGVVFTLETLGMQFSRINPLSGLKRMFSIKSVVELVKSLLKISVIGYVAYSYIRGEAINVLNLMGLAPVSIAAYIATVAINAAIRICIALLLLGILDYAYQWWDYEKNLKMSKEEVKEEYKQMEGNPEIKAKIKQKQRQLSMGRMLQEVPKADVIITNPTHFAIAIKYDAKISDAPIVIAKGQDFIAQRIKEVAKENGVEIVENKPLARTLYDSVEIGQKVPPDLFQAVAEVLAFVYSLKKNTRAV